MAAATERIGADRAPRRRRTTSRTTWPGGSPRSTTSAAAGPAGTSSPPATPTRPATSASTSYPLHADRYERAAEFVDVVTQAVGQLGGRRRASPTRRAGVCADTDQIHPIDHVGEHFRVARPAQRCRAPRRAGRCSCRPGRRRTGGPSRPGYAEAIFTAQQTLADAQEFYADIKRRARGVRPRPATSCKVLPGIVPVIGSHRGRGARRCDEELDELIQPEYALAPAGTRLHRRRPDGLDLDEPLPARPARRRTRSRARAAASTLIVDTRPSARTPPCAQLIARLGGGRGHRIFTGTPEQVADAIQEWFAAGAADGFNVMPPWLPGGPRGVRRPGGADPAPTAGCSARSTPEPRCATTTASTRPASQYAPHHRGEDRMTTSSTTDRLGRTGVQVSPLTLGAMMFGAWGNPDHDESIAIIHRALDAGINVIDTADVYARGESEEIVGKALQARKGSRDDVFLATKFHGNMHDEDPNQAGNSRRWIVREVEDSLRRLQADHIDLYQVHRPRPEVDIDETLGALDRPRPAGQDPLPRHVDVPALAGRRGAVGRREARSRERPVTEQPPYSHPRPRGGARHPADGARSTASACCRGARWRVAGCRAATAAARTRPCSSSRLERQPARHDPASPENKAKLEAVHALQELADEAGLSLIHLALGFVLAHPAVSSAIIGPRTLEQLESQLGAEKVVLARRRARPDRRDRAARHDAQRGRPGLRTAGPRGGGAAASVTAPGPGSRGVSPGPDLSARSPDIRGSSRLSAKLRPTSGRFGRQVTAPGATEGRAVRLLSSGNIDRRAVAEGVVQSSTTLEAPPSCPVHSSPSPSAPGSSRSAS